MNTGHLNVGFREEDASVEGFLNLCVKWWYLQLATFFGLQPWQRAFGYGENNQGTDWSLCLLCLCFTPIPKYPDLLQNSAKLFCLDPYKFIAAPKNSSTGNWFVQQKPWSQQLLSCLLLMLHLMSPLVHVTVMGETHLQTGCVYGLGLIINDRSCCWYLMYIVQTSSLDLIFLLHRSLKVDYSFSQIRVLSLVAWISRFF